MTTEAEGQRLVQIVRSLVAGTEAGRIRWKQTDQKNTFLHTTKGGYLIRVHFAGSMRFAAVTGGGGPSVQVTARDGLTLGSYEPLGTIAICRRRSRHV